MQCTNSTPGTELNRITVVAGTMRAAQLFAMADYRAAEGALRNRTQELLRLRLAREARMKRRARRGSYAQVAKEPRRSARLSHLATIQGSGD